MVKDRGKAVRGYLGVFGILLAALFTIWFRSHVVTRIFVSGDSMDPALKDGDVVLILECGITIQRNDIIVVGTDWGDAIKRVVGIPGDEVLVEDGMVYVNGVAEGCALVTLRAGAAGSTYTVPEGCYFVMGDNRGDSRDSRDYGAVTHDSVKGKVVFRLFPPGRVD